MHEIVLHVLSKTTDVWENGNCLTIGSDGQLYDELWRICCTKRHENPELKSVLPLLGSWHWLRKENLNVLYCLYAEFLDAGSVLFQSNGCPITDSQDPSEKVHAQDRIVQFTFQYLVTLLYKYFFDFIKMNIYQELTQDNFSEIVTYEYWELFMTYLNVPQLQRFLEHASQYLHGTNAIRAGVTDEIPNSSAMFNLLYFITNKCRYSMYALIHEATLSVLPELHKSIAMSSLSVSHDSSRPVHNVGNDESLEMSVKDVKDFLKLNPQISSFNGSIGILGMINNQKESIKNTCSEPRMNISTRESKIKYFEKNDVYRSNHDAWRDVAMVKILSVLMDSETISARRLNNSQNQFEVYIDYIINRADLKSRNIDVVSRNIDMREQPPVVDQEYRGIHVKGNDIRSSCIQQLNFLSNQYEVYGNPNQLFDVMASPQPTNASNSLLTFARYNEQSQKKKSDKGIVTSIKQSAKSLSVFLKRLTTNDLQRSNACGITDCERESNIITSASQSPTAEPFVDLKTKEFQRIDAWRVWQMLLNDLKLPMHGRSHMVTQVIGPGIRSFDTGMDGPTLADNSDVTVLALTADAIIFPYIFNKSHVMRGDGSQHNTIANISCQLWKYIASTFKKNPNLCHVIISFSEMDKVFTQLNRVNIDTSRHIIHGLPSNEVPTCRGSKIWKYNKNRNDMARYSIFAEQIAELCIDLFDDLIINIPDDLKVCLDNKKVTFDGVAKTTFELTPGSSHRRFVSQENHGDTVELLLKTIPSGPRIRVVIESLQKFQTGCASAIESSLKILSMVMMHVDSCIRQNKSEGIMVISHVPCTFDALIHYLGNLHILNPNLILPKVIFQGESKPSVYINKLFFQSMGQMCNSIFPTNMPLQLRLNQWLIITSMFSNPFSPPLRVLADMRERLSNVVALVYSHTKNLATTTDYEDRLWMSTRTSVCNIDAVELMLLSIIRQANASIFKKDWGTFFQDSSGIDLSIRSNEHITKELCEELTRNLGVSCCKMPGEVGLGLYAGRVRLHVKEKIEASKPRNFLLPRHLTIPPSSNSVNLILKDGNTIVQAIALTPEMFLFINPQREMTYVARFCNCVDVCSPRSHCLCKAYCNPACSPRCNAMCSKKILQKRATDDQILRKRSRARIHSEEESHEINNDIDIAEVPLNIHDQVNFYLNGSGTLGEIYRNTFTSIPGQSSLTSDEMSMEVEDTGTTNTPLDHTFGGDEMQPELPTQHQASAGRNETDESDIECEIEGLENQLFSTSSGTNSTEDEI